MRILQVRLSTRARLWLNGEIPVRDVGSEARAVAVPATGACKLLGERRAGLEIRVRTGPRTLFGFLECSALPGGTQDGVQVKIGRLVPPDLARTMASWFDVPVSFGMIAAYESAIVDAIRSSESIRRFGGNVFEFGIAAHDAVDSAPKVFEFLSRTLLDILGSDAWPPRDDFLVSLLGRPM